MKRSKSMEAFPGRKWRLSHILLAVATVYLLMIGFKFYRILEPCPLSVSMGKNEMGAEQSMMFLPCGLEAGSSITVIGSPLSVHEEKQGGGVPVMSQFIVELQGLKAVDGEEPPKILHFNPRLKGDWSGRPVIEHNTCYRLQWGKSMRCDGIASKDDDDDDDTGVYY